MSPALVLVSHGSPEAQGNEAFLRLADEVRGAFGQWRVEGAFLERAHPAFADVLGGVLGEGCAPVAVVPCLLFPGGHAGGDIPAVVGEATQRRAGADVRIGRTLGEHEAIADILQDEVPVDALSAPKSAIVLAAAGSIAVANREAIEKLAGTIRTRTGLSVRFGYLDQGDPLITEVLSDVMRKRPPFVPVLPCLLFPGLYLRTLTKIVEGFQISYPGQKLKVGPPMGADPRVRAVIEAEAKRLLS